MASSAPPPPSGKVSDRDTAEARRSSPRLKGCVVDYYEGDSSKRRKTQNTRLSTVSSAETMTTTKTKDGVVVSFLVGDPVPDEEARMRWPWRYERNEDQQRKERHLNSNNDNDDILSLDVKCHYYQAEIEKCIYNLGDCAYVKGENGGKDYVGRILEFFKTMDNEDYFRVQWFFRAEDTVMQEQGKYQDKKRLFYSELMNDNPLECIVSKVKIVQIKPSVSLRSNSIPKCDFYYDMKYSLEYSTFCTNAKDSISLPPPTIMKTVDNNIEPTHEELSSHKAYKEKLSLLDVYAGCGGMSTGLCFGLKLCGLDVATKWAVDANKPACESLRANHPDVQVRHESAEDFLDLLKEWEKLCKRYLVDDHKLKLSPSKNLRGLTKCSVPINDEVPPGEFEVASLVDVCYGDPGNSGKRGLQFQVRWVGYGPSEDTWEPIEGLRKCHDKIREFVIKRHRAKMLPLPGDVDVICGGPPCQGISGYNRHRNVVNPLGDERNRQIIVFMDIVNFLKPKYVLMENVVDILRFAEGLLGRYALSRLLNMNYQARLGIMAAGCYGLPQFRLRVFLWGAHPAERLPQFPLPTHDTVLKYGAPSEFERNVVAFDEGKSPELEKALVLEDALSDLPSVKNEEAREKMSYENPPRTAFQKYIRAVKWEMDGTPPTCSKKNVKAQLLDHRPLPLHEDDYLRVCKVPHRKGANFRDLPGVVVGDDNVVRRDPSTEIKLPSGKPLIPEYAINLSEGKSTKPFSRLWWDETVATVLCTPDLHTQAVIHPEQDRILTIRETARLQGFADYYIFCGNIKQRYAQIGNAVAVPVSRALGYALGMAMRKLSSEEPVLTLPHNFSHATTVEILDPLS